MSYQPIDDYGIIGNLRTVALIAKTGSIDWFCFPRFDSPSVFGAILDANRGGHFRIGATVAATCKQVYWPDTNVLVTRFLSNDGVGEVVDYMPVRMNLEDEEHLLIRRVRVARGSMRFRMECQPAFNYGRDPHRVKLGHEGASFYSQTLDLRLSSDVPLRRSGNGVMAEFTVAEGSGHAFVLYGMKRHHPTRQFDLDECDRLFHETIEYWRSWLSRNRYRGRWREMVNRSALALKLLTYEPTGAIVAAPTCSLPESLGGSRNWDYRYAWVRDAAFTLYSLLRIGFTEEATKFISFLDARCHELKPDGALQTVYGIDGRHELKEEILDHWEGYRGSRPVRIGNAAYRQRQLDIYGELMDSLYLYNKHVTPISNELWVYLRRLTNWVCRNWRKPDNAIWEVRGGRRQFVYSKLMCWVAIDRAWRLAEKRSFPADRALWKRTRDQIYTTIMKHGWSEKRQAFVQYFGSDAVDASNLLMPLVFFMSPTDPQMQKTIDAINRPPAAGGLVTDGLVFRYDVAKTPDGLKGTEGTFNICTFWLVEALTRASGEDPDRLYDARLLFEQMLGYANHLGLYAEQIDRNGAALGNFPQALTHLALISAAYNLDQYLDNALPRRKR